MKQFKLVFAVVALACWAASAQAQDTLAKISTSGQITMGVRESAGALSYTVGNGVYVGYHVDLCQRIIKNIEKAAGRALEIKYQLVTAQNRIPLLKNGTIDIECGSTTNSRARQKNVTFAFTTFMEQVRIAVKADSDISSFSELAGKTVTTATGTTSVQLLRKKKAKMGINFKEVFGKDHADSFLLLESGRADAFVLDSQILAGLIATSKDPSAYKIVGEGLSVEPIAIMLRKDDSTLRKIVDDTLKSLMKSGEIEEVYNKWFVEPIPPRGISIGLPVNAATKAAWANPTDKPGEDYRGY